MVLDAGSDHDPMQGQLAEADIDQRPARSCDMTSPFLRDPDPVADLAHDPERIRDQTCPTDQLTPAPEAATGEASGLGRHHLEEAALLLDRPRVLDPRHPHFDPFPLVFDGRPQRFEVVHLVVTKDDTLTEVDGERTHRWPRHSSSRSP
jgi:hypothetical protein